MNKTLQVHLCAEPSPSLIELKKRLLNKDFLVSIGLETNGQPNVWINWGGGVLRQLIPSRLFFNGSSIMGKRGNRQTAEKILSLNKMTAYLGEDGTKWPLAVWPKEYVVYFWDTQVLGVQRKVMVSTKAGNSMRPYAGTTQFQWLDNLTKWEAERLIPHGQRALHVLGLDFGKVHFGINRSSGPILLGIDSAPQLPKRLVTKYAAAIENSLAQWLTTPEQISLGADPEFMLLLQPGNKMVPASRFFPREGIVGCDSRRAFGASDELPLAEVRPQPANHPYELMENLNASLTKAASLCPYANLAWLAGSEPFPGYPVGGHIHFGTAPNSRMIRALDQYLAMPLSMVEIAETGRRRRQFYGHLGDFRFKDHGFEYRVPASWLVNPEIAKAAIILSYLVCHNYRQLPRWDFGSETIQKAFYQGDFQLLQGLVKGCKEQLAALTDYDNFAKDLLPLWQWIEKGVHWNEHTDIRQAWKLPIQNKNYKQPARPSRSFWPTGRQVRIL